MATTSSQWVREVDGCGTTLSYTYQPDPRFQVVADIKHMNAGVMDAVFGNRWSDGGSRITGWSIRIEGSRQRFGVGSCKQLKAQVAKAEYREWALGRVDAQRVSA